MSSFFSSSSLSLSLHCDLYQQLPSTMTLTAFGQKGVHTEWSLGLTHQFNTCVELGLKTKRLHLRFLSKTFLLFFNLLRVLILSPNECSQSTFVFEYLCLPALTITTTTKTDIVTVTEEKLEWTPGRSSTAPLHFAFSLCAPFVFNLPLYHLHMSAPASRAVPWQHIKQHISFHGINSYDLLNVCLLTSSTSLWMSVSKTWMRTHPVTKNTSPVKLHNHLQQRPLEHTIFRRNF